MSSKTPKKPQVAYIPTGHPEPCHPELDSGSPPRVVKDSGSQSEHFYFEIPGRGPE